MSRSDRRKRRKKKPKKSQQEPNGPLNVVPGVGRQVVKLFIKDARYYPEEKSIAIVGEEVETRRPVTSQALVSDFIKEFGIMAAEDDHDAWRFFAQQLCQRKDPITLVFLATRKEEDEI
tara:strand:+ start:164 stop:520 length:357 start_codon:yes stop_codon:yes gene_type:complete